MLKMARFRIVILEKKGFSEAQENIDLTLLLVSSIIFSGAQNEDAG